MSDPGTRMRAVAWSGAAMLALSLVLQVTFPRAMGTLPAGLHTPVLALEIARTPWEMESIFASVDPAQRAQWIAQCNRGNALDFAFIVIYGSFLVFCARAFESARPSRAWLAAVLAVLAGAADAAENGFLFAITARLGGEYRGLLSALIAATWLKWFAIAVCLAVLSPALRVRGGWGTLAGGLALLPLPIALAAAIVRGAAAEAMLIAITLAFLALWIEALRARARAG